MSFDEEPQKGITGTRMLLWHGESECLFEVFTDAEQYQALSTGEVEDVTDVAEYEDLYKQQQGTSCKDEGCPHFNTKHSH